MSDIRHRYTRAVSLVFPTMARDRIAAAGPRVCLVRQTFFTIPAALKADIDHLLRSATFSLACFSRIRAGSCALSRLHPSFLRLYSSRSYLSRFHDAPTTSFPFSLSLSGRDTLVVSRSDTASFEPSITESYVLALGRIVCPCNRPTNASTMSG